MMAGLTSILPSPPNKAARQTGDALPPPAESELTTGRQHIKHTMDVNTSGGQRHGEASYKVRVSSPVGESFDARAARLGAENKRKQRAWSRAHALAYEQREATRGSESDSEGDSLHLHPTPPHPIPCHTIPYHAIPCHAREWHGYVSIHGYRCNTGFGGVCAILVYVQYWCITCIQYPPYRQSASIAHTRNTYHVLHQPRIGTIQGYTRVISQTRVTTFNEGNEGYWIPPAAVPRKSRRRHFHGHF
jgi:hypothetical protein